MQKSKFIKKGLSADDLVKAVYENYKEELLLYIQTLMVDMPDLVDDVLMETMYRVLHHGSALLEKEDLTLWIFGVARMTCREYRRVEEAFRQKFLSLDSSVNDLHEPSHMQIAYQQATDHPDDTGSLVAALIQTVLALETLLTERERTIFQAYWIENLSIDELMQQYGLAQQTVYNTIHQCRKKIRDYVLEKP